MAVDRAAVNQTLATAAPNIFFLMRRCLNGRNVACIRSKEIAARFVTEAAGKKSDSDYFGNPKGPKVTIVQKSQLLPKNKISTIKLHVTNMSATARLTTILC